jgi:acyl carrier protein
MSPGVKNMDEMATTIRDYLLTEVVDGAAEIDASTPLLDSELVDSMGVLKLVGFLEDEYGVMIGAEDLSADNFANLGAISEFIKSRL